MRLGVCAQALYDQDPQAAFERAVALGFEDIELPVDAGNPFTGGDLSAALWHPLVETARDVGLGVSALSTHQESQLLLGPYGSDTDAVAPGTAAQKQEFAIERMTATIGLAESLGIDTVIGFTGCADWSRWFPWPLEDGWAQMGPGFVDVMAPLLDECGDRGVSLALEAHPRQFIYNLETAHFAMELLGQHEALGFNFDPANLLLAGMDPVTFVVELGGRIRHVHAKDGELVAHASARSGLLAHGPWDRPGRGFRFRVPGWGDLDWKALITELQLAGFGGTVSVEHEDPTMSRSEGLAQAVGHLSPILLREPPGERFW